MATKIYTAFHDTGASYVTPPATYGPITVPNGTWLVKAEWSGLISFPPVTNYDLTEDTFVRGVQFVASGGSPLDIDSSDKNKDQWLWLEIESCNVVDRVVWAPDTADNSVISSKEWARTWRGQRPVVQALDFYISVGISYSTSDTYRLYSNLTLWYTT